MAAKEESAMKDEHEYTLLVDLWTIRPCFICERFGPCEHREIEADRAELQAARYRVEMVRKPASHAEVFKRRSEVA